jgi:hypothetical protein
MPKNKKKKYGVTLYYHSSVYVEVSAEDEEKAVDEARSRVNDGQVLENLIEECQPDVMAVRG